MKISIGDLVDRLSIVELKIARLPDNKEHHREKKDLLEAIQEYKDELPGQSGAVEEFLQKLTEINGHIWDLEADIRQGREGMLGLEEVGRRALQIRNHNSIRVEEKNKLNALFDSGYQEVKIDHAASKE